MAKDTKQLSREEIAQIEVGHTAISGRAAWVLVVLFALTIVAVPVSQIICETRDYLAGVRDTPLPQSTEIFQRIPEAVEKFAEAGRSPFRRLFNANATMLRSINMFEDDLEDEAVLAKLVLSPMQSLLTDWLGAGNEQAYIGRGQWLFYRPGIDYVTGPGFLDPRQLAKRASGGNEWQAAPQPDPRRAIIDFKDQLAERGIKLIVMPTPVKPMIHPEKFSEDSNNDVGVVQNPSFDRFKRDLEEAGVAVFDVAPLFVEAADANGKLLYLATDTHWRPETMELAARKLAAFIRQHTDLQPVPPPKYKQEEEEIENLGDIAAMLKLPSDQDIYKKEKVTTHQVLSAGGELWRPSKTADVLLLGDSFTNVYSVEAMGWGASAGLAEHLSYSLRRPVDCIARNDNGSHATREMLSIKLAKGRDRLEGKRVVVYQFADRELAIGDWKMIAMKLGQPRPSNFAAPDPGTEVVVTGVIEEVSSVPKPGSVVYKDHILSIHLIGLESTNGPIEGNEAIVHMWSMRDNVLTPAARYRAGKKLKLRLKSWYDVSDELEPIKRSDLSDEALALEDPCWAEEF